MKVAPNKNSLSTSAKATMTISQQNFGARATGKMDGMKAFMTGKLKVKGDMGLVMKMQKYF